MHPVLNPQPSTLWTLTSHACGLRMKMLMCCRSLIAVGSHGGSRSDRKPGSGSMALASALTVMMGSCERGIGAPAKNSRTRSTRFCVASWLASAAFTPPDGASASTSIKPDWWSALQCVASRCPYRSCRQGAGIGAPYHAQLLNPQPSFLTSNPPTLRTSPKHGTRRCLSLPASWSWRQSAATERARGCAFPLHPAIAPPMQASCGIACTGAKSWSGLQPVPRTVSRSSDAHLSWPEGSSCPRYAQSTPLDRPGEQLTSSLVPVSGSESCAAPELARGSGADAGRGSNASTPRSWPSPSARAPWLLLGVRCALFCVPAVETPPMCTLTASPRDAAVPARAPPVLRAGPALGPGAARVCGLPRLAAAGRGDAATGGRCV